MEMMTNFNQQETKMKKNLNNKKLSNLTKKVNKAKTRKNKKELNNQIQTYLENQFHSIVHF